MNKLTRRKLIVAAVAAVSVVSTNFQRIFDSMPDHGSSVGQLVAMFERTRVSAKAIGREYLRRMPGATNETRLVSMICGAHGEALPIGRGDQAIREWVCVRSRDDFREGRVVEVGGWMLSVTEARLCALVALS